MTTNSFFSLYKKENSYETIVTPTVTILDRRSGF